MMEVEARFFLFDSIDNFTDLETHFSSYMRVRFSALLLVNSSIPIYCSVSFSQPQKHK